MTNTRANMFMCVDSTGGDWDEVPDFREWGLASILNAGRLVFNPELSESAAGIGINRTDPSSFMTGFGLDYDGSPRHMGQRALE